MTIRDGFEAYRTDVIAFANQSPKTEENHLIAMRAFVKFLGSDLDCEAITFEHVRDWKSYLSKSRSPATVRNYIIKLRVVLSYLRKKGYNVLDPDLVQIPKRQETVARFVTKEQVHTLIDSTRRIKNKCIISFLWASGLRVSELCRLDRGQIHNRTFTVVGKGGTVGICFIDERTERLLDEYLVTRTDNHPALFLADNGRRINPGVIQETFKSIRKVSGIDCSPHSLRHGFATNLLRSNTNLFHVSKLMRHKSLDTTKQYLHVVDEELRAVYNAHHTV